MRRYRTSSEETPALLRELDGIIANDRYFLSPRVQKGYRAKLRPAPAHEPLPPPKVYASPRFIQGRRRRG